MTPSSSLRNSLAYLETLTISASKPCIGRNSAATGGSTRVWFWRSRPKKAAPVHGLTRKKSHQPRPGSRFSAQRRRLLDLPGQDAGRSSNDCNRAMAHNLFCIRRQSAVGRGTPCQLALATGSGTSASHGPGLRGNSQLPCSNPKLS